MPKYDLGLGPVGGWHLESGNRVTPFIEQSYTEWFGYNHVVLCVTLHNGQTLSYRGAKYNATQMGDWTLVGLEIPEGISSYPQIETAIRKIFAELRVT